MAVTCASVAASVSSEATNFGFERSTSKITSGSVATRASAQGQTPRDGRLSLGARIKEQKRFLYPNRSISCIQPPALLAISSALGGIEEGAQPPTWKRNKLVFLRNPANSKGMAEARPVHQDKTRCCNILISGRLSDSAKKARSLTISLLHRLSCSNDVSCSSADTNAINPSSPIPQPERERGA
jgi:hypothetical protein